MTSLHLTVNEPPDMMSIQESHSTFDGMNQLVCRKDILRRSSFLRRWSSDRDLSLNKLRFSLVGVCGRDEQKRRLLDAYNRVRTQQQSIECQGDVFSRTSLALIHGPSGVGKTTLALNVRGHVEKMGGVFAVGKFDLRRGAQPYSAFVSAFLGLWQNMQTSVQASSLSTNKKSHNRKVASSVDYKAASKGDIILNAVKELTNALSGSSFTGQNSKGDDASPIAAKERMKLLLCNFVDDICRQKPFVLFIDDLQWADESSLDLLEVLITDRKCPGLMFIGAYRSNFDSAGRWAAKLRDIKLHERKDAVDVTHIYLGDLDVTAVNSMLADLLSSSEEETQNLAKIIHSKTHGNAFFVTQYLKSLEEKEILSYNLGTLKWHWDEERICNETSVTANVAEFLREKLLELPAIARWLLQVIASVGACIDESTIRLLVKQDNVLWPEEEGSDLESALSQCVGRGMLKIVRASGTCSYHFTHDQIQEAAYSLIPLSETNKLKLRIGEAILKGYPSAELETVIFVVTDLINSGIHLLPNDPKRRREVVLLNLRAGMKAFDAAAYTNSEAYLQQAANLLEPSHWETELGLSLEIYNTLGKAQFCSGNIDRMQSTTNQILSRKDIQFRDKFAANLLMIDFLNAESHTEKAIEYCCSILEDFGVRFTTGHLQLPAAAKSLLKTKRLLKKRGVDSISSLPTLTNSDKVMALRLMDMLFIMSGASDRKLLPLVVCKSVRWTLRYGLCAYSINALAVFAALLCGGLKDPRLGFKLGKVAVSLAETFALDHIKVKTHFSFYVAVHHIANPMNLSLSPLLKSYQLGMASGDVTSGFFSIMMHCITALFTGARLDLLQEEMRQQVQNFQGYNQTLFAAALHSHLEFIRKMRKGPGDSDDADIASWFSFSDYRGCIDAKENHMIEEMRHSQSMMLSLYFCEYELAWRLLKRTRNVTKGPVVLPRFYRHILAEGIISFSLARRRKGFFWKRRALRIASLARKLAQQGNQNCIHLDYLFRAETAVLSSDSKKAKEFYDKAIAFASRNGWIHDRALANERAGEFFASRGDDFWSSHYLSQAHQLYVDWGAMAKASHLKWQHASHMT